MSKARVVGHARVADDIRDRWARAVQRSNLSEPAKTTAWALREYANARGTTTVGVRRLAENRGRALSAIDKHLKELVRAGFIERIRGAGIKGRGGTTTMTRLLEVNASAKRSPPGGERFEGESVHFSRRKRSPPGGEQNPVLKNITHKDPAATRKPAARSEAPVAFDEIRDRYPTRAGGQGWADAEKAYRTRLLEGYTHEEILAGVERYRAYVEATGNTGGQYVKMARTFLGPGLHFREDWHLPPASSDGAQRSEKQRHELLNIAKVYKIPQQDGETDAAYLSRVKAWNDARLAQLDQDRKAAGIRR